MNTWRVLCGDVRERLAELPAGSARCCVTSPPYWGLRDYGMSGQLGLESTPDAYCAAMVDVFREVRRVLADDGTLWLNMGDTFSEKQLQGIPWRVAFALQADGWCLRSDIIWSKPNPMPESVTDRPTKAHEYVFLLSKNDQYYYNATAIQEQGKDWSTGGPGVGIKETRHYGAGNGGNGGLKKIAARYGGDDPPTTRNKRSVWTINTQVYQGAHFATFPEALIEPCILAGSALGDTVLDPFTGSGTTGAVAVRHQRNFVGCELNPAYVELARTRIDSVAPMFAQEVA
jgi:DNA modification methylase